MYLLTIIEERIQGVFCNDTVVGYRLIRELRESLIVRMAFMTNGATFVGWSFIHLIDRPEPLLSQLLPVFGSLTLLAGALTVNIANFKLNKNGV